MSPRGVVTREVKSFLNCTSGSRASRGGRWEYYCPRLTKPGTLDRGDGDAISVLLFVWECSTVAEGGFEATQSAVFWGWRWVWALDELRLQ